MTMRKICILNTNKTRRTRGPRLVGILFWEQSILGRAPSGNQTWHWKIPYHLFYQENHWYEYMVRFPASHLWLPEGRGKRWKSIADSQQLVFPKVSFLQVFPSSNLGLGSKSDFAYVLCIRIWLLSRNQLCWFLAPPQGKQLNPAECPCLEEIVFQPLFRHKVLPHTWQHWFITYK